MILLVIPFVFAVAPDQPTLNSPTNDTVIYDNWATLNITVTDNDSSSLNVSFYQSYESCSDAKSKGETTDGNYTIIPINTAFEVYCADMNTNEPKTYLNLIEVMENNNNYAYYPRGGLEEICNWTKVQIYNLTGDIQINSSNKVFTSCSGTCTSCSTNYGYGWGCEYIHPNYTKGLFNINLTGTPFRVNWEGGVNWIKEGSGTEDGAITINESDGIGIEGWGYGFCGGIRPNKPPGLILTFQDNYSISSIGNDTNVANGSYAIYNCCIVWVI